MDDEEYNSDDGFIRGDDGHGNLLISTDITYVPRKIAEIIERLERIETTIHENARPDMKEFRNPSGVAEKVG